MTDKEVILLTNKLKQNGITLTTVRNNECVDDILDREEREDEQYVLRYTRASIEKVLYGMGHDAEKRLVDAVADVMAGIPIIKLAIETKRIQKMLMYQKLHKQGAEYQRTGNINAFFR